MSILIDEQRQRALEVMREYLAAPKNPDGRTLLEVESELDQKREELIDTQLKPLLDEYLEGRIPLGEFKSKTDGINKRHEYWGFKGIKGQMFFNMIVNVADNPDECNQELKAALMVPANEDMARSRMKTFASFVRRIGDQHVDAGGSKHGRPKPGSIPFFLSYFWQIQDRRTWPVYYTNGVNTMADLNLWQPSDDHADNYIRFKNIHEELATAFSEAGGRAFGFYEVEHVFWFKGGNPWSGNKPPPPPTPPPGVVKPTGKDEPTTDRLPDSYVPPIVAILPRMARNEPALAKAAKASGTSLERAFEKSVHTALTMLGYNTKLLGQGQGRVPDGRALDFDSLYGILWDAKIRSSPYSMGTDDRTIREYIVTQSRELKKRHHLRNIYYIVISSQFADDYDDSIRSIKMDTDTSEVCLVEAGALVAMVDAKLRDPLEVTLGPDGLQRLFSVSGIMTAESVLSTLG